MDCDVLWGSVREHLVRYASFWAISCQLVNMNNNDGRVVAIRGRHLHITNTTLDDSEVELSKHIFSETNLCTMAWNDRDSSDPPETRETVFREAALGLSHTILWIVFGGLLLLLLVYTLFIIIMRTRKKRVKKIARNKTVPIHRVTSPPLTARNVELKTLYT